MRLDTQAILRDIHTNVVSAYRADRMRFLLHLALITTLAAVFLLAHALLPRRPAPPWLHFADQSRYLRAAKAWSEWDLTPSQHWYPPGYSMLGALFQHITVPDQFFIPNLACLLLCCLACISLALRMFPEWRFGGVAGSAAFLVGSVGTIRGLDSWLVPWTTTPATATTLFALVAVLRLVEQPGFIRALTAGALIGSITLFRPGDVMPVAVAAALAVAPVLLRAGSQRAVVIAVGGIAGAAAVSAASLALIAATTGFGAGTYYELSARFGFEWELLASRWVSLVVSGNPIYDGVGTTIARPGQHVGLAQVFPWVISGVGGIAACLACRRRLRTVHVLLAVWLMLHVAQTLVYRDLHITGFWLFWNYHYFKPVQPVLVLFTVELFLLFLDRNSFRRCLAASFVAIVLAFGWRAELHPVGTLPPPIDAKHIQLPEMKHLDDGALISVALSARDVYDDRQRLFVGKNQFANKFDFRIYRRTHDIIVVPLRHLPSGLPVLYAFDMTPAKGAPIIAIRQELIFGLPCLFNLAGSETCGTAGTPLLP